MSNLNELAFPLIEEGPSGPSISCSLTKHEYAAILLAGHLSTKYEHLPNSGERSQIAGIAYELAEAVLSYFK